ncbi:unnamed protein product [Rotaria magnacalcarata]|uniref:Fibronectin type-III domain-containing protein n=1 Tax=Rotaria magnacalcarata TaxID=392030 RepID=A0A819X101_9BILA|nr:unnamed protein product [Rotaria magnacalcarata]
MHCNFFLIEFFAIIFTFVNGSHFLGGTISWHPLNSSATGSPVAIVITQTYSWTWTAGPCSSTDIANSNPVPFIINYAGITNTLNCVLNCGTATEYVAPNIWPYCTDFSTVQGTTVGQRSDIVYLNASDDFTVAFSSTAWRPLATAGSADWSLASHIILTPRSDNGLYNNAPVATVISPIYIPQNQSKVINIPIADADGDPMRCRWASGTTECGQVCPPGSLPSGTIIFPNCTVIITGTVISDWFAVTVVVEDFINSSSTTPLSSVPIQFLVEVVAPSPCTTPPEVYELSEASCTPITVGQTYTSQLIAINYCGASVTITDIATLSFPGMIRGNLIQYNSTVYYATLSWTPTIGELGYQVMCAMAVDSQNSQSSQYCFAFFVSQNSGANCPGYPTVTSATTTTTSTTTTTTTSTSTSTTTTATTSTSTTTTTTTTTTTSTTSTTSTSTTSTTSTSLPKYWAIYEENGPFELYHIERCTDSECQWQSRPVSSEITFLTNAKKYFSHEILNENFSDPRVHRIQLSPSCSRITPCSNIDEHGSIKLDFRRNKKASKANSLLNPGIKSPFDKSSIDTGLSNQRVINKGTIRVTRVKSSISKALVPWRHKAAATCGRNCSADSINDVGVTRMSPQSLILNSSSFQLCSPSIIENTIRLDENIEMQSAACSSTINKKHVRVKRCRTSRQKSAVECCPSQVETIELASINDASKHKTLSPAPSIRVECVHIENAQSRPGNTLAFESACSKATVVKKVPRKRNVKFGAVLTEYRE